MTWIIVKTNTGYHETGSFKSNDIKQCEVAPAPGMYSLPVAVTFVKLSNELGVSTAFVSFL